MLARQMARSTCKVVCPVPTNAQKIRSPPLFMAAGSRVVLDPSKDSIARRRTGLHRLPDQGLVYWHPPR